MTTDIETEFTAAVEDAREEMNRHLRDAQEAVNRAVAVSERTGIPLHWDGGYGFMNRIYVPGTFEKKWGHIYRDHDEILEQLDLWNLRCNYSNDFHDGWEEWSSSSLTC